MELEFVKAPAYRAVAVVGDTLAAVVGKPEGSYPILAFNVTDQPAGSDVFSGLGTAGADVPFTSLGSATLSASGWHSFTVTGANGEKISFDVVCFPAAALNVNEIKYANRGDFGADTAAPDGARRALLRSLAMHATKTAAETALEGGAATAATAYGTKPSALGAAHSDNMTPFGSGW